jgi:hypothetical protein
LESDGGVFSSPGQCYLSWDAWNAKSAADAAWRRLRSKVGNTWEAAAGIPADDILAAAKLLGIDLGPAE